MAAVHTFYDICAHPNYVQPLREEVVNCVEEEGGWSRATIQQNAEDGQLYERVTKA